MSDLDVEDILREIDDEAEEAGGPNGVDLEEILNEDEAPLE
jgi:hypothetical protein